ncbi:ABC transporter ATP-binding protein [Clostridium aestuarii]|uniref:ABC transporter ATP-binding protein n=1 Tax=Clostridium aestuarii TaxID=338193 RepID=A0ABT4D0C7_9CLOT|nr:ABC transporter ATP-binding protein [Clostridium aestuarii]MCY6483815.1 ABC transporter ATP-binding protein [Clostridium aestuarii]
MIDLMKKLYIVSGKESKKITNMLIAEVIKGIFEGITLGVVMLLLLKVCENIFGGKSITKNDVLLVFFIMLGSVVGKIVSGYIADRNKNIASYNMGAENRLLIGDRLKHVHMGYFNNNRLGDVSGGLTTVIGELETTGIYIIEMLLVGVIQTAIMALFMIPFDWITGVIILITLILGILINNLFQEKADSLTKKLLGLKINLNSATLEYVQGIGVIKAFGQGNQAMDSINQTISDSRKGFLDVEKALAPAQLLYMIIFKLGTCAIILTSLMRYGAGQIEIEKTIMLMVASFIVFGGFEMAGSMQGVRGIAMQNLDTITKLRNISIIEDGEKEQFDDINVKADDIAFSYDKERIIDHLSCLIPEKKTTALVGPSGSGKTTLCHLIARFWDVQQGKIMISDTDVKEYKYDDLLSHITMVFQDVYLFEDTVKNNIKFGKPDATDEEVIEIAKKACCHEFIMELPNGYDTILHEGGISLSGGERQRISIARAMLKESVLVILDEATSSIDPENEEKLMMALKELLRDKTAIIIAHRLSTIQEADQIIVMDNGEIAQNGLHSELKDTPGIYRNFIKERGDALSWKISEKA